MENKEDRKFFMNCINYIYETYKDYDITCHYLANFITPSFDYNVPILLLSIEKLNNVGIAFTFNKNKCTYGKGPYGKGHIFTEFYRDYFHINVSNFDDFKAILNKHFNILVMKNEDKKEPYYEVVTRKDGKERVVGIYNENDYQELLKIYNETDVYKKQYEEDVSEISDSELSILSKKYIENNQPFDGENIAVFKKLKSDEKKFIGFYSKKDLFDVYSFIIEQLFNVIFIDKNELSKDEFKIVKDKYLNFENYEDK